jgi:hypothetical protein
MVDVLPQSAFDAMAQFEIRAVGPPSPPAETLGATAAAAAAAGAGMSDADELDSDGETVPRA